MGTFFFILSQEEWKVNMSDLFRKEVKYFHRDGDKIICDICPVRCSLREGQRGICRGRAVSDGKLYATNYCKLVAWHLDPIEKKPLYHFHPGSKIWSTGPNGCNLKCKWCQNCEISQGEVGTTFVEPDELARRSMTSGSIGLAYTYTEPLIWFETIMDTAPKIRELGGVNVLVSNGYIEEDPLNDILKVIDAANIDIKVVDPIVHKKMTGADLDIIKKNVESIFRSGIHLEVTHLMVTGVSDNPEDVEELAKWIADINEKIPLHISRYFPRHKWDLSETSLEKMELASSKASNFLDYVYEGNTRSAHTIETVCPNCGATIIERSSSGIELLHVNDEGLCTVCGEDINVVF
jgi:pyruvate formate lyase activating enzyme